MHWSGEIGQDGHSSTIDGFPPTRHAPMPIKTILETSSAFQHEPSKVLTNARPKVQDSACKITSTEPLFKKINTDDQEPNAESSTPSPRRWIYFITGPRPKPEIIST